ncbi:MAG: endopeptidase La [Bacilli bacterium]|nr:endopeptidase La [Bacilli bacterium]
MIKSNLPVILLKGLVLLPHEEVRIELNNDLTKKTIELSNLYHDDEVLIVSPINSLEESPDSNDLPKIAVVGKVKSNISLPNGNSRILLVGLYRVKVYNYVNYSNEDNILEAIISNIEVNENNEIEETALLRKLFILIEDYIISNPNISNSIMSQIKGLTDLGKLTDLISNFINLSFDKKFKLMCTVSSNERAKFLIKELAIEKKILDLEKRIDETVESSINKSQQEFILKEKIKHIKSELGEIDSKEIEINKFNEKIESENLPKQIIEKLNREITRYSLMSENSPEISTQRNYIDTLLNIPFGKYTKDVKNINKIKKSLDKTHYGISEIKERILEYIAVNDFSNSVSSQVICLVGPPGVGKTTFAYSVANALNKKFAKISLGGLNDISELVGHRRTYIGSYPGKIITSLIKTKSLNPVILLDEVDKLTKDYKGDPTSVLLDMLDATTNKYFVDNYVEEEVDLSKILFILTANDEERIPPALLDRLEVIHISGYTAYEKLSIAKNYILNKIKEKNGLNNEIKFDDEAIYTIINNYTKESGVRELERLIEKIVRKIILKSKLSNSKKINIRIKKENVSSYLGPFKYYINNKNTDIIPGYVKGLAYSLKGGTVIEVEVTSFKGTGKFKYTGRLGKLTHESIEVVLSYIKSNSEVFKIDLDELNKKDYHINFRNSSILKEGSSAGTVIATSIISYIKNKVIDPNITLTGEMNLNGDISKVGGLREKIIAASLNKINKIYVPYDNKEEVKEILKELNEKIEIIYVKNYIEIYEDLFV